MKTFITYSLTAFLLTFIFLANVSRSAPLTGEKAAELNTQIIQEVKEVLQNPLLKYETRDLSGEVQITTTVESSGKIIFSVIDGLNENLTENVRAKLNSLNLWTSPDYSGKTFKYDLNYKN